MPARHGLRGDLGAALLELTTSTDRASYAQVDQKMSQKGSATSIRLGQFFEHGLRLSFAKQLAAANIVECSVGKQLQCHIAVQNFIPRAVHDTLPPLPICARTL
jgi:hypothetical protein